MFLTKTTKQHSQKWLPFVNSYCKHDEFELRIPGIFPPRKILNNGKLFVVAEGLSVCTMTSK